ncbi:ROK family protein [Geofilum rubicundum]|uniref:Hypothetical sugar kinase, ROK family n=1 Tax=Geofilum rubicundum JCM 15548 TaxID=1236989 RepID=A0A0E9LWZ3_9BACT|nr:ROK family protein [Geofilum rubicundum]GAO29833.1 hypothetical sugar kinase, ROK family [Geofilum rubicundum JCM 15548]
MIKDLSQNEQSVIGVFLGGKILRAGRVNNNVVEASVSMEIDNYGSEEEILSQMMEAIEKVITPEVVGVGIGVPSLVDVSRGIVYNVEHIPSWRQVQLADLLKSRFEIDIYVNNDANCFAVGEKYYGKGRPYSNMVGVIAGEGLGVGIITNDRLYSGTNCGAGEFGYIPYRDHNYEHYCTPGYFELKYGMRSKTLLARAKKEDKIALAILEQFGIDMGHFIQTILFALDPQCIILGGPIASFYPFFESHVWKVLRKFPYPKSVENLTIAVSDEPDVSILGAAALYFDAKQQY